MSWLKPSSSNNSIHDASASRSKPSTGTSSSSTVGTNGNKHSQPPVTRFLACGTVYLTHTLSVPSSVISPPSDPTQDSNSTTAATAATTNTVRAKQVTTHRGGTAVNVLSLLAQFNAFATRPHNSHHNGSSSPSPSTTPNPFRKGAIECALVSPFGSDPAGRALLHELELEGVRTRFCKLHPAGVPTAFVLQSDETPFRTVINHNPLPDLSHEDFIAILGPILVPEHYQSLLTTPYYWHWHPHPSVPHTPPVHSVYGPGPGLPPITTSSTSPHNAAFAPVNPLPSSSSSSTLREQPLPPSTPGLPSNPPFTIFHVTSRSPSADAITLLNLTGIDGLARDRSWRDKATFTLDCTTPVTSDDARVARLKLFPHVDVIFFSKAYALSVTPPHATTQKLTPRSFLLSQVPLVAPHALLFVHWDHDGGALLSVPTREYIQSSVWTDMTEPPPPTATTTTGIPPNPSDTTDTHAYAPPEHRPETQLSLGSADPRYNEFGTLSSNPYAAPSKANKNSRQMPRWANEPGTRPHHQTVLSDENPISPTSTDRTDSFHQDDVGHVDHPIAPVAGTFDYGFAEAFANVTPDSSWDYRANRTAAIYDSGDGSETDYGASANNNAGGSHPGYHHPRGLGIQTERLRRGGTNANGVFINEGVALSPSDVDSDVDVNVAAVASRFVMEERIRRVYGPMETDPVESDALDLSSLEGPGEGNDSDVTESGARPSPGGPTRIGKLKREKMRQKEEEEERLRREEEERQMRLLEEEEGGDKFDSTSVKSEPLPPRPPPLPKPKPPVSIGVVEAWQAGLLYALTRHVLPGPPYCPTIATRAPTNTKGNSKSTKKLDSIEPSDWAWKWRLDECLRFAAELAGRRARKETMEGLAQEMEENGWLQ